MTTKATTDFADSPIEDAFSELSTSTNGLSENEAERRINESGYNELSEKRKNPFVDFLRRYWGPMPWLLELTMALSYIIGHYLEVGIVFGLLTKGHIPLFLTSTSLFGGKDDLPHWVVLTGYSGDALNVNNPLAKGPDTRVEQERLERNLGYRGIQCAVVIRGLVKGTARKEIA
jgi:cation transport ATPase-like protein